MLEGSRSPLRRMWRCKRAPASCRSRAWTVSEDGVPLGDPAPSLPTLQPFPQASLLSSLKGQPFLLLLTREAELGAGPGIPSLVPLFPGAQASPLTPSPEL